MKAQIAQIIHNEVHDTWTIDYTDGKRRYTQIKTEELPKTAINFMIFRTPIRTSEIAVKFVR